MDPPLLGVQVGLGVGMAMGMGDAGGVGKRWGGKSWSAQAAFRSTADTYFSQSGRQKCRVWVPADPVPGEGPLLVHRWRLLMTESLVSPGDNTDPVVGVSPS